MSLVELASGAMMLIGFCFAYLQRNSHEGIGVYGVIVGIIGVVLFCTEQRKLIVNNPRETKGGNKGDITRE
jgi:hypothetical protein